MLKGSRNLVRDAYIISKVQELRRLGNYLLFMIKKTETGDINYENLPLNIQTDKEFLLKEFFSGFNLISNQTKKLIEKSRQTENGLNGVPKVETSAPEDNEAPFNNESERKIIITDNIFKVEEVDNELITEEFEEAEQGNEEIKVHKGNYLELIEIEREEGFDEIAFGIPGEDEEEYEETLTEEELSDTENSARINGVTEEDIDEIQSDFGDAFSIPGESRNSGDTGSLMSAVTENEKGDDKENDPLHSQTGINGETNLGKGSEKEEEKFDGIVQKINADENKAEQELSIESDVNEIPDISEEISPDDKMPEDSREEEIIKTRFDLPREIETEPANEDYLKYEKQLLMTNEKLNSEYSLLISFLTGQETLHEKPGDLLLRIEESCSFMEKYSMDMSFTIITNIYKTMKMYINSSRDITGNIEVDTLHLFRESLVFIDNLVKGIECEECEAIISKTDKLREALGETARKKESEEKARLEKERIEKQLNEKYTDVSQKADFKELRNKIAELQTIFNSLYEIKGQYRFYESIRKLSSTLPRLKEMVSLASRLALPKIINLSEASYNFIKFVQNYRLDPLDEDIKDIFNYIIYNFKAVYLDKPTKELEIFIKHLNNPEKIFTSIGGGKAGKKE